MKKSIIFLSFGMFLFLLNAEMVKAIPSFARKYQTSCVTCHTIYPQLNAFGEAFRINGYQFPVDDEEVTKEKLVPLGAEANKKVFPNAVWPNSIPSAMPISLRGLSGFQISTEDGATTSQFVLPSLQVLAAGTFGKDISIWAGATLFNDGMVGNIDNFFVKFDNILTDWLPEKALYIRVGQFIPELVPFASHHRGVTMSPYAMNTYNPEMGTTFEAGHSHGAAAHFGIEGFQVGAEASGVIASRLRYVAGFINGSGIEDDPNSSRDFYGRLAYKIGGLAYDGTSKDSIYNNEETSFSLGVFGYKGVGTGKDTIDFNFSRFGSDINFSYKKFTLIGGVIIGNLSTNDSLNYNLLFCEANYMFYPWLMGLLRYEEAKVKGFEKPIKQFVVHSSALIVANIKFKIETRLNTEDMKAYNLYLGLDFGF